MIWYRGIERNSSCKEDFTKTVGEYNNEAHYVPQHKIRKQNFQGHVQNVDSRTQQYRSTEYLFFFNGYVTTKEFVLHFMFFFFIEVVSAIIMIHHVVLI